MNSNLFRSVVPQVRRKNKDAPNLGHPSKVQNQAVRDLVQARNPVGSIGTCLESTRLQSCRNSPKGMRVFASKAESLPN
jgi:hypothetical protein